MPGLKLPEGVLLMEKLRRIYLRAEQDILDAISYKRGRGLIDYAETAAMERVQLILAQLQDACWDYVPKLVESHFYEDHPEAARLPEPAVKHRVGYLNAAALTGEQTAVVSTLTANLMGNLIQAAETARLSAATAIGRLHEDVFRRAGVRSVASMEALGEGAGSAAKKMITALRSEGVTAFTDKAGRDWSLYNYCNMVTRTTGAQAGNLAILTRDPEQDLFQITAHGTTCPVCAPLEGRVYSKSGGSGDYPPLCAAFGKVDPRGPDSLMNSYLNVHPNCLHALRPYSTVGMRAEEVERDRRKSSFRENPPERDPRSAAQIESYRKQQAERRKFLASLHEYQAYRAALGDKVPKTAQTFLKHKAANDNLYQQWKTLFDRLG